MTDPLNSQCKLKYNLNEFYQYHDEELICEVYKRLLFRDVDIEGLSYYIEKIRNGTSVENVIYQIYRSKEAKKYNVKITGLSTYIFIDKILSLPILGNILSAIFFLFTIRSFLKDMRALKNHLYRIEIMTTKVLDKVGK
ncbi:DUF4214 domain-containing protein [Chromobacterium violaceum]|uniref:DUF4214 domain-containing protein n=1 Tax=Chromobacterium violaceum TaxID=536 RepID=UPI001B3348EA|nr:DUF4214 domain-containing protein [Chromobacterium violaceum]MBP4044683.1 DUF4214 domain-containing protein [Chromobacterium violaceum]